MEEYGHGPPGFDNNDRSPVLKLYSDAQNPNKVHFDITADVQAKDVLSTMKLCSADQQVYKRNIVKLLGAIFSNQKEVADKQRNHELITGKADHLGPFEYDLVIGGWEDVEDIVTNDRAYEESLDKFEAALESLCDRGALLNQTIRLPIQNDLLSADAKDLPGVIDRGILGPLHE